MFGGAAVPVYRALDDPAALQLTPHTLLRRRGATARMDLESRSIGPLGCRSGSLEVRASSGGGVSTTRGRYGQVGWQ